MLTPPPPPPPPPPWRKIYCNDIGGAPHFFAQSGDGVMTPQVGRWDIGVEGDESAVDSTTSLSQLLAVSEDVPLPARAWEGWEDR